MDEAVAYLGSTITAEIQEATEGAKTRAEADLRAQGVLNRWFNNDKPQPGQFADPALLFAK